MLYLSTKSSIKNSTIFKVLENFQHPYVKIIAVCKICNKEQAIKLSRNFKRHFESHRDQEFYKCNHCEKSFTAPYLLKGHVQRIHCLQEVKTGKYLLKFPTEINVIQKVFILVISKLFRLC